ncbi:MAG TPA: cell envelope integrity protein TolA, partial [Candidatus Glassbacteria bacterium]|nr:cell envelope integrity protein TolA [Candidatus Glassbacteria bacterium]
VYKKAQKDGKILSTTLKDFNTQVSDLFAKFQNGKLPIFGAPSITTKEEKKIAQEQQATLENEILELNRLKMDKTIAARTKLALTDAIKAITKLVSNLIMDQTPLSAEIMDMAMGKARKVIIGDATDEERNLLNHDVESLKHLYHDLELKIGEENSYFNGLINQNLSQYNGLIQRNQRNFNKDMESLKSQYNDIKDVTLNNGIERKFSDTKTKQDLKEAETLVLKWEKDFEKQVLIKRKIAIEMMDVMENLELKWKQSFSTSDAQAVFPNTEFTTFRDSTRREAKHKFEKVREDDEIVGQRFKDLVALRNADFEQVQQEINEAKLVVDAIETNYDSFKESKEKLTLINNTAGIKRFLEEVGITDLQERTMYSALQNDSSQNFFAEFGVALTRPDKIANFIFANEPERHAFYAKVKTYVDDERKKFLGGKKTQAQKDAEEQARVTARQEKQRLALLAAQARERLADEQREANRQVAEKKKQETVQRKKEADEQQRIFSDALLSQKVSNATIFPKPYNTQDELFAGLKMKIDENIGEDKDFLDDINRNINNTVDPIKNLRSQLDAIENMDKTDPALDTAHHRSMDIERNNLIELVERLRNLSKKTVTSNQEPLMLDFQPALAPLTPKPPAKKPPAKQSAPPAPPAKQSAPAKRSPKLTPAKQSAPATTNKNITKSESTLAPAPLREVKSSERLREDAELSVEFLKEHPSRDNVIFARKKLEEFLRGANMKIEGKQAIYNNLFDELELQSIQFRGEGKKKAKKPIKKPAPKKAKKTAPKKAKKAKKGKKAGNIFDDIYNVGKSVVNKVTPVLEKVANNPVVRAVSVLAPIVALAMGKKKRVKKGGIDAPTAQSVVSIVEPNRIPFASGGSKNFKVIKF